MAVFPQAAKTSWARAAAVRPLPAPAARAVVIRIEEKTGIRPSTANTAAAWHGWAPGMARPRGPAGVE